MGSNSDLSAGIISNIVTLHREVHRITLLTAGKLRRELCRSAAKMGNK